MVLSSNLNDTLTLPQTIASAGLAGCTADLLTFPLDTVKVWLQVRGEASALTNAPSVPENEKQLSKQSTKATTFRSALFNQSIKSFSLTSSKKTVVQTNVTKPVVLDQPLIPNSGAYSAKVTSVSQRANTDAENRSKAGKVAVNQIKPVKTGSRTQTHGLLRTITQGVRSNGFFSLYGGITAGLQRQVAFCAVRIGLYDSVKGFYHKLLPGSRDSKHLGQRMLAGITTAFIAVGLFQPTEVVKIRMQAQTTKAVESRLYSSSFQAYRSIFKVGVGEAWKGVETNAARLAVVNVCELVTYDVFKEFLLDYKLMKDNPACHFTSAFLSGFVTTVIASPVDVVKTRYMNSDNHHYRNPLDCAKQMLFNEGFRAFYKGFVPAYLRLGTWNIAMFVSYEQYKVFFNHYNQRRKIKQQVFL